MKDHFIDNKGKYSLDLLSKATGLSKFTLKWWCKNGILRHTKNPINGYHEFYNMSFYDICDICLYQNMGMKLKDIRRLDNLTSDKLNAFYYQQINDIEKHINKMQNALHTLTERKKMINYILTESKGTINENSPPSFNAVIKLNLNDKKKIKQRIDNQVSDITVWIENGNAFNIFYGVDTNCIKSEDCVIWRKNPRAKYYHLLHNAPSDTSINGLDYITENYFIDEPQKQSTLREILLALINRGEKPTALVHQWLISFLKNNTIKNYFSTWIETE